jgi:cobalt/nickel transport system permease protein
MGLVGTFGGYYLYESVRRAFGWNRWRGIGVGAAVAAWTSVVVASILCAIDLALSGTVPLNIALPAMVFWHVMIGIGEAVITVIAVGFIFRTRPDLIYQPPRKLVPPRPLLPR